MDGWMMAGGWEKKEKRQGGWGCWLMMTIWPDCKAVCNASKVTVSEARNNPKCFFLCQRAGREEEEVRRYSRGIERCTSTRSGFGVGFGSRLVWIPAFSRFMLCLRYPGKTGRHAIFLSFSFLSFFLSLKLAPLRMSFDIDRGGGC